MINGINDKLAQKTETSVINTTGRLFKSLHSGKIIDVFKSRLRIPLLYFRQSELTAVYLLSED